MRLQGKQLDAINAAIKSGGGVVAAIQTTCEQVAAVGQVENVKPLTAEELLGMANQGEAIPADRVLATFAERSNWAQIYGGTSSTNGYKEKACEWAFIGPVRPPFELAQWGLKTPRERAAAKVLTSATNPKPFHPMEGSQLLKGVKALQDPNWHTMNDDERLLRACLLAYVKHHMGIDIVGWDKLGEILHNAICQNVGDDEYVRWGDKIKAETNTD